MIGIYKITSSSNKVYIGHSNNIERRFNEYHSVHCKGQIRLYNSLIKYGVDNHKFEVLEECVFEELNNRERYYQDFYNVLDQNLGLNCTLVKTNTLKVKVSNETKIKQSNSFKNRKDYKEIMEKLRVIDKSGSNNGMFNKKHSEDSKLKMKLSKLGIKKSPNAIANNIISRSKTVLCTKTNKTWINVKECSIVNNIPITTLRNYLNNKHPNKTTFVWKN